MVSYFGKLEATKKILWCYLIWYLAIVSQYLELNLGLWMSSIGISVLIGFALNLAARQKGQSPDKWVVFRLYIFPFCVSSYSALIKDKGFFLLFPTSLTPLFFGIASCTIFVLFTYLCKVLMKQKLK
jgi:hypothetical protein